MAFENVNVSSLRSAINSSKDSLNSNTSSQLINNISDANVWSTDSKETLKKSLSKLVDEKYKDLKDKLDSYLNIITKIEEYKTLDKENDQLELEYQRLNSHSSNSMPVPKPTPRQTSINTSGSLKVNTSSSFYDKEMDEILNKIRTNEQRMKSIENEVSNLI